MSNENLLLTGNQGSGDTVHFAMLMIKPDGSRDHTFSPNGLFLNIFGNNNNSSSYGLAITTEGKIYLGGYTRTCTGGTCGPLYMGIARYTGAPFPTWTNTVIPDNSYMVFPNPVLSDGYFQLKLNAAEAGNCYAWNLSGQTIPVQKINSTVYRLQNAVPGQYLLQHVTNNGRVQYARMLLK
ncbi:MAG TPA: T9SS type A sorting domain-containing protein, partial [Chitinophagaceae bacterium]|nr:T9SS type A sorting domain-containing protein [Chitinophagaceae bacterium]